MADRSLKALLVSTNFQNFPFMKIFSAAQTRAWDEYTIREEPITSEQLMERAAHRCFTWLMASYPAQQHYTVLCGKGNNGGDGLAIARMLAHQGKDVHVHVLEFGHLGTADFQLNLSRLHQYPQISIRFIQQPDQLPELIGPTLVIDALYGSGLNRALDGLSAQLVQRLNESGCVCVAIDLPSGLFADSPSLANPVVKATHTLCLQGYKLAMMMAENEIFLGQIHLLNIGLHQGFYTYCDTNFHLQLLEDIKPLTPTRSRSAHKGNFGHALLVCGSIGKMGAAVLAAKGALRSGVGLLTCQVPSQGTFIMQTAVPEAMCTIDKESDLISESPTDLSGFQALGIGPGLGTDPKTAAALEKMLTSFVRPLVIDADALNIIATHRHLFKLIPPNSILTPHPKEFARLFGESANDFERMQKAIEAAHHHKIIIVLKGHHSMIVCPDGKVYFNGSGNPGMATGGMGDVLTGIITGLMAQQVSAVTAARLGVYLHGLAGNLAASSVSQPALLPSDLLDHLGAAWLSLD
jgi:NAD(P)H-hydrate epimerase